MTEGALQKGAFSLPQPVQVVIDDVGWWCGEDGSARQEPFRTAMPRPHAVADYQALIDLGRRTGTRPVAAFVLGEWDRWNLLRTIPSATWMGAAWDNRRWSGPWLDEAADLLRRGSDHLELALHGLCHEFWHWEGPEKGTFTRAEWFTADHQPRPLEEMGRHLNAYLQLWDRHQLGPHPRLFVPCAFRYQTGLGPGGLGPLLREAGVRAVSTPFNRLGHAGPAEPEPPFFFDDDLLMLDRSQNDISWRLVGGPPAGYQVQGPTLGLHWPQLLHQDPDRNGEAVDAWVRLLHQAAEQPDLMLAPNSTRYMDQLLHRVFTTVTAASGTLTLDARRFFSLPGMARPETWLYLKQAEPAPLACQEPDVIRTGSLLAVPLQRRQPVRTLSFVESGKDLS